jgi:hypothetical protein
MNKSYQNQIVIAAALKDKQTIQSIHAELTSILRKMDYWFDMFLDRFDEKLSSCDRSDPVKKLYNSKFEEYSNISRTIKVAEYYMKA